MAQLAHISDEFAILLMSFIGGYIDVVGYLLLFNIFTGSITGNLVVATTAVDGGRGLTCRGAVCAIFTFFGGVGAAIALRMKRLKFESRYIGIALFFLELVLLLASWFIGLGLDYSIAATDASIDSWSVILVACMMGASMGAQCAAVKDSFLGSPSTTVMTSNLINFATLCSQFLAVLIDHGCGWCCTVSATTEASAPPSAIEDSAAAKEAIKKRDDLWLKFRASTWLLVYFIAGAIVASLIVPRSRWHSFAIPVAIVIFVIVEFAIVPKSSPSTTASAPALDKAAVLVNVSVDPVQSSSSSLSQSTSHRAQLQLTENPLASDANSPLSSISVYTNVSSSDCQVQPSLPRLESSSSNQHNL